MLLYSRARPFTTELLKAVGYVTPISPADVARHALLALTGQDTANHCSTRRSSRFGSFTAWISTPLLLAFAAASLAGGSPIAVNIGQSVIPMDGPWKFHIGDDPAWAESQFDDSDWETVDLTPSLGAHDSDVGLTGYVSGWNAKGHAGYFGFAWYRMRIDVSAPQGEAIALLGPAAVDSAYQLFVDGQLVGSAGDFSLRVPVAYSIQPQIFPLRELSRTNRRDASTLLAFRVWMGSWASANPTAGGIHIAPSIGTTNGVDARYRLQWLQTVSGYIVEVVEALLFVLLALMACSLIPLERRNSAYLWIAGALLLIALYRANQAFFFWTQYESVQGFELLVPVLLIPLILCAWVLAWAAWFQTPYPTTILRLAVVLTFIYIAAQFFSRSWFHGVFSGALRETLSVAITCTRLAFLLLLISICIHGVRQNGRKAWLPLTSALLIAIGLFAQELSALGIRGIWFPFGTGVSRTQYAYAAFDLALFILFLRRLYEIRGKQPPLSLD